MSTVALLRLDHRRDEPQSKPAELKSHVTPFMPDFTPFVLSNEAPISDAIEIVSAAKKRNLSNKQQIALAATITNLTGAKNIGALRDLKPTVWKKLHDTMPLIMRVYLKQLIEQSSALPPKEILECEFNSGLPLEFSSEDLTIISMVQSMGFDKECAIEAIIVTQNGSIEAMLEYAMLPIAERNAHRHAFKLKLGRFVPYNRHWTIVSKIQSFEMEAQQKTAVELSDEMAKLKQEIVDSKAAQIKLAKQISIADHNRELILFESYLNGLLSSEHLSVNKVGRIPIYRDLYHVSNDEFQTILSNLGETESTLNQRKAALFSSTVTATDNEGDNDQSQLVLSNSVTLKPNRRECVICMGSGTDIDILFIPCMHCVVCSDCFEEYMADDVNTDNDGDESGVECPVCRIPIHSAKKVFW